MSENSTFNRSSELSPHSDNEIFDLKKIISSVLSHKFFFACSVLLILLVAYIFNSYTIPVYKVTTTILINEEKKNASSGNDQFLEGFGLMPGMKNFDNQMMVLSSRNLVSKALDELPLDTEYFYRGLINKKSLYPEHPMKLKFSAGSKLPEDVIFGCKYLGNDMINIDAVSKGSFEIHNKYSLSENIEFPGGSFRIERIDSGWFNDNGSRKLYFTLHSRRKLVENYIKRLKISRASKEGSIVRMSIEGTNKEEDLAFLTKLSDIFLNISLERKNTEAIRTIQFIDDQLAGISDSLLITENKLQQFRSNNRVMNISAQGQVIIDQAMRLENEKARLGIESNYYEYLTSYLEKDSVSDIPVAPATMGITDPGLTKLVADLAEQQGRLYSKSMGDKNPLQSQLAQKVMATKDALRETLRGLSRGNSLALKENQVQINTINEQASTLPRTERQLLGIERKYKLNDELYTFLLEKRAMAQIQKASNVADNEIVDYPEYENQPVWPKKPLVYLLALLIGIGFPFFWILFKNIFNVRIKDPDEINKISSIPVSGHIPHSVMKERLQVINEPDSPSAEAFRLLRSRMGFFTKEIKSPVILITSAMPKEGKTLTAINLASSYSLLGKKTVLIGFDLRQPKIYSDFGLDNDHGLTTWLTGIDILETIIKDTPYTNLKIITSGPVPSNPAELTTLDKTAELITLLKKSFDCIVIDTAPLGTVADTFHLLSFADACILVVRQNVTFREMLTETVKDLKDANVKCPSILVNDIMSNGSVSYKYSGKYKYKYASEKRKGKENNKLFNNTGFKNLVKVLKSSFRSNRINS
jgi:tyrosine-protein kinase Etk/Wzc